MGDNEQVELTREELLVESVLQTASKKIDLLQNQIDMLPPDRNGPSPALRLGGAPVDWKSSRYEGDSGSLQADQLFTKALSVIRVKDETKDFPLKVKEKVAQRMKGFYPALDISKLVSDLEGRPVDLTKEQEAFNKLIIDHKAEIRDNLGSKERPAPDNASDKEGSFSNQFSNNLGYFSMSRESITEPGRDDGPSIGED